MLHYILRCYTACKMLHNILYNLTVGCEDERNYRDLLMFKIYLYLLGHATIHYICHFETLFTQCCCETIMVAFSSV